MNDLETHSPERNSDLELIVESLQRQVFLLLLALIIVSATVVFYLCYQSRTLTSDLAVAGQPQVKQIIDSYQREKGTIDKFGQDINSYALTHPDFQRVLAKYGWTAEAAKQQKH